MVREGTNEGPSDGEEKFRSAHTFLNDCLRKQSSGQTLSLFEDFSKSVPGESDRDQASRRALLVLN